ncbi:hypothetical protein [Desulfovibrio sp. TomC]|uniref:hypothetical protein n=1 Tax=Desulfovibrio sp. TomC TaxID=1562888 RepID=UPI000575297D|nr:hypothetical protein [Desulfovibrio sp. TomC]KHK01512.1 hypothetical protein NY78_3033 [Desulfovibrio sp. TomC]
MNTFLHDNYKGYQIDLTPRGDYCASFAADIRDSCGRLVSHLGVAGNTEDRAVARSRELVDFELAYGDTRCN